jgi:glycosyltransferase involved in cell wall biosynthesis
LNKKLNVHLLIVVRSKVDKYWTKIEEYIKKNNIQDNITVYNYIPQKEMFELYEGCDVMVSNWVHDGMPQSFFEASLRGLPIIMNDLPQYKDYYVDRVSAMICDGSCEGITAVLEELIRNPELLHLISENGLKVIKEKADFDKWADVFISEMIKVYKSNKFIKIPLTKMLTGKILILLIWFSRRWPLSKIRIKV